MTDTPTPLNPRAWIGCMECYEDGHLVGIWTDAVNADQITPDTVHEGHDYLMPPTKPHVRLCVLDYEDLPTQGLLTPTDAEQLARTLLSVGTDQQLAFFAWIAEGNDPNPGEFSEKYEGEFPTFRDFAQELAAMLGLDEESPQILRDYFNWSKWTADQRNHYTVIPSEDGVYVFAD